MEYPYPNLSTMHQRQVEDAKFRKSCRRTSGGENALVDRSIETNAFVQLPTEALALVIACPP